MKRVTRKFHAVVVQDNDKEMPKKKKVCCTSKVVVVFVVVANETFFFVFVCVFVLPFSLPPSFSITRALAIGIWISALFSGKMWRPQASPGLFLEIRPVSYRRICNMDF